MGSALIQIVDDEDRPVEATTIDDAQKNGKIHRIVRVMVEDPKGNILLQKRTKTKGLYPGRWDNSAAGHVDEGENYEPAAARELAEEIGLKNVDLYELGYYRTSGSFEGRTLNRFNKAYKVIVGADTKFIIQPDEVAEVRWFTLTEAKRLVQDHPDQVTDGILEVFERFY